MITRILSAAFVVALAVMSDGAVRAGVPAPEPATGPTRVMIQMRDRGAAEALLASLPAGTLHEIKTFEVLPWIGAVVSAEAMSVLKARPDVISITEDGVATAALTTTIPLIGADVAAANGFTGAGGAVAVLDTGIEKSHPLYTGAVVSEACYSTHSTATSSLCPGHASSSTAVGSGEPCYAGDEPCNHGTWAAGAIAGRGLYGLYGVARGVSLVSIQVYSTYHVGQGCPVTNCALVSDIVRGLDRVLVIKDTFNVTSVLVAAEVGLFSDQASCDAAYPALRAAVASLRDAGIATVAPSGNSSRKLLMAAPGCITGVVSVGETSNSDQVSTRSNSRPFLSLLSPGSATSSWTNGRYQSAGGTSRAAAHVAGAFAVLKHAKPSATVDELLSALRATGTMVTDPGSGTTTPRINVYGAVQALSGPPCTFTLGSTAQGVPATSGRSSVRVTPSAAYCSWSASGGDSWLSIVPSYTSGIGTRDVAFQYQTNTTGGNRTTTIFVAGKALNITQVAPVVSVRPCCDANGDGSPDLFWRNTSSGGLAVWFMSGRTLQESVMLNPASVADNDWLVEAVTDLDGDGDADLIWRHRVSGDLAAWVMNGRQLSESLSLQPGRVDVAWRIAGAGDFNGDGRSDLFWQNDSTGGLAVWFMDGVRLIESVSLSHSVADTNWKVSVVTDMDADGDGDLVWRHSTTGELAVWFLNGHTLVNSDYLSVQAVPDAQWVIAAAGDFNGDGWQDLVWQNGATGDLAVWLMSGRLVLGSEGLGTGRVPDVTWKIVGPG